MDEDKCPVCGSDEYVAITPEDNWFHIWGCSGTQLHGCLGCGTVYMTKHDIEKAKEYQNDQT